MVYKIVENVHSNAFRLMSACVVFGVLLLIHFNYYNYVYNVILQYKDLDIKLPYNRKSTLN